MELVSVRVLVHRCHVPHRPLLRNHFLGRPMSAFAKQDVILQCPEVEADHHYWPSRPCMSAEQECSHAAVHRAKALKAASVCQIPPPLPITDSRSTSWSTSASPRSGPKLGLWASGWVGHTGYPPRCPVVPVLRTMDTQHCSKAQIRSQCVLNGSYNKASHTPKKIKKEEVVTVR